MKHLTGQEALDQIVEAEKAYFTQHGATPTVLRLPQLLAYYLQKHAVHFDPEYRAAIWKDGIAAFVARDIHGLRVELLDAGEVACA